ncbi:MAG: hypothetical protein E6356_16355 [Terrisporobacter othiniensis]|uniref:Uncharacterized protein n=2 Tax=Terrisporobacter TaxID=1505652 RepID=A0AAX2ZCE2_9FIRM|nr:MULTISPECIES: hypothetical protein [Terrisporobacter]MBN9646698.1 hypothetical protein [Terrisporobacter glycolicus]MDU4859924.1 hypothetical protein [Terrisporobacter othiniensis]MDU6996430.1 hypothetical protein [Terrisporobacter othiniensis]UEL46656.1 hypothetical protein JW646_13535 [Terrisporobacter hibernicus]UPA29712.1 hypothetical protein L0P85_14135 [Terrisporobacter glycolicus]
MDMENKNQLSIMSKVVLIIHALYSYVFGNFVMLNVNDETLAGSVTFGFNNTFIGLIISASISFLLLYFCFKGKKLAITLIFVGAALNVIFALMMIETSNFSFYNVIVIGDIVISALVVYLLRPIS